MKRHMDLIKRILEYAEQKIAREWSVASQFSPHSSEVVQYHIGLCADAGYLMTEEMPGEPGQPADQFKIGLLTWAGHDALEKMRA